MLKATTTARSDSAASSVRVKVTRRARATANDAQDTMVSMTSSLIVRFISA